MFLTALSFEDAWSRGDVQQVLRLLADDADVTVAPPLVAHVDDGAGPHDAVATA